MERKFNKQPKLHVRKGDNVIVIAGNSKGKTGIISQVITEKSRAIIEGVNLQTKHIKPTASTPQGSIEKREGSVHISNIMLVDPKTGKPTRTGRKLNEEGKLQRYSKETGNLV